MMRAERDTIKRLRHAYKVARLDLMDILLTAYQALGDTPTPAQVRGLVNQIALIRNLETRLKMLGDEVKDITQGALGTATRQAINGAIEEIGILARALDITPFPMMVDEVAMMVIEPAIAQIPALSSAQSLRVMATVREGLARGDRFRDVAKIALAKDAGAFRNGQVSAELFARRAIVQANNNSKLITYERAGVEGVRKQIIAHIDSRTTRLSLQMHGEIQDVGEPFRLKSGPPAPFARFMMAPPFHWNDRDTIVPYHAAYEAGSTLTTSAMKAQAAQAIRAL